MQTLSDIRAMLTERGLRPKHRLGQNFLHDHNQLRKLITAADVQPGDLVLEVGPGTGTLTEALLEAGAEVIACEIDPDMAAILDERLGDSITLIEGDCLDSKHALNPCIIEAVGDRPFTLIANLPYNVASPLMMNLLVDHLTCKGMFVTVQKEVADRLLATPSTKAYGSPSIVTQVFARVELVGTVSASCFWPQPEVTSAMVAIVPFPTEESAWRGESSARDEHSHLLKNVGMTPVERRRFARFVIELFTKRRKQLGSIFGRDRSFPADITPDLRPEALSPRRVLALWISLDSIDPR